jgi:hypothetical protein
LIQGAAQELRRQMSVDASVVDDAGAEVGASNGELSLSRF